MKNANDSSRSMVSDRHEEPCMAGSTRRPVPHPFMSMRLVIRSHWISYLICVALFAFVTSIYWHSLSFPFCSIDDYQCVGPGSVAKDAISSDALFRLVRTPTLGMWHPITTLSHTIDCRIFEENPAGHRLHNIVIHALNTILVYVVLLLFVQKRTLALFGALVFGLHPLCVESVVWVAERKNVLSTFFLLLSLLAYKHWVQQKKISSYLLVTVLFVIGLMSKSMLVTLPFCFLLLDLWLLGGDWKFGLPLFQRVLPLLLEKIPWFILSIIFCVVTVLTQKDADALLASLAYPFKLRALNVIINIVLYLKSFVFPDQLTYFYSYSRFGLTDIRVLVSALLICLVTWFCIRSWKTNGWMATGWFWFLGTLVPVVGLVQAGYQARADRYMYVPMIGLILIAVMLFDRMANRFHAPFLARALVISVIAVLLSMVTYRQISYWSSTQSLEEHSIAITPENIDAHYVLAKIYQQKGLFAKTEYHFRKALTIAPARNDILFDYSCFLVEQNKLDSAEFCSKRLLNIDSTSSSVWNNLGVISFKKGRAAEALWPFAMALKYDSGNVTILENYRAALSAAGQQEQAVYQSEKAHQRLPDSSTSRQ